MAWLFFLPPLAGFFLNGFRFQSPNKKLSGAIGVSACLLSFLSIAGYVSLFGFAKQSFFIRPWLHIADLSFSFSFSLDPLSLLMGLLITGVGSLIHLYSWGYMSQDLGLTRYFAYFNLFIFMMLVLVFADSLPLLFLGWEGVGLCSYLLISFWHKEKKNVHAGWMAFVVNRVGDACFLLGMFCLFFNFGTVNLSELNALFTFDLSPPQESSAGLGIALLFLGAAGKSAQIPFHFWLEKAMAGPTPVSALIHAATMVTAGVYLLIRLSAIYSAFPNILLGVAWIGAITALGAGLAACRQWDFKRVLAYSTISQLGYLFIAMGAGAFSASFFHLLTHGFFKALLFLCAGSVIHSLRGEQDIRLMGGLKKSLPITFWAYLTGAFALMAFPPFSGFFSKDQILWSLFSNGNYGLLFIAFFTGLCTVFYMTRLTVLVFFGKERFKTKPHESGAFMTAPLIALAFLALLGGGLGIPHLFSEILPGHPPHLLNELLRDFSPLSFKGSKFAEGLLMILSVGAGGAVMITAGAHYLKRAGKRSAPPAFWKTVLEEAFFVQRGLKKYILSPFERGALQNAKKIEQGFFNQGPVRLVEQIFKLRGVFASLQNGNLQAYALYFVMGLAVMTFLVFLR